jgi:hypothetical protein
LCAERICSPGLCRVKLPYFLVWKEIHLRAWYLGNSCQDPWNLKVLQ